MVWFCCFTGAGSDVPGLHEEGSTTEMGTSTGDQTAYP